MKSVKSVKLVKRSESSWRMRKLLFDLQFEWEDVIQVRNTSHHHSKRQDNHPMILGELNSKVDECCLCLCFWMIVCWRWEWKEINKMNRIRRITCPKSCTVKGMCVLVKWIQVDWNEKELFDQVDIVYPFRQWWEDAKESVNEMRHSGWRDEMATLMIWVLLGMEEFA